MPFSPHVWKNGVQSMNSRSVSSGKLSSTRTPVNSGVGTSSARHSIGVRRERAVSSETTFCRGAACDLRIASSDSQLGLPEVKFGIIPDVGGSTRLPAVVGLGRAKELIMTARLIGAEEAERIGLVNRVVAPEDLERATQELVDELTANSHIAVGRAK